MEIDKLTLTTKNDIPFPEAQITIHQPTIKEIGLIGEDTFFLGCQLLTISKDQVQNMDSQDISNFDIFMNIIQDKNPVSQKSKICAQEVLLLLFPKYRIQFMPRSIVFIQSAKKKDEKPKIHQIDASTFDEFRDCIKQIFDLKELFSESRQYNIDENDARSRYLKNKFEKRHKKLAKIKDDEGQKDSIFSRYISILAVGQKKSINTLTDYSVYQLMRQFKRFTAKQEFDIYIDAKLAGASDLKEVQNWMGDLDHPDDT